MNKKLRIRNSTAEFLTFASQNEGNSIEVRFEENTLWLTQQLSPSCSARRNKM